MFYTTQPRTFSHSSFLHSYCLSRAEALPHFEDPEWIQGRRDLEGLREGLVGF